VSREEKQLPLLLLLRNLDFQNGQRERERGPKKKGFSVFVTGGIFFHQTTTIMAAEGGGDHQPLESTLELTTWQQQQGGWVPFPSSQIFFCALGIRRRRRQQQQQLITTTQYGPPPCLLFSSSLLFFLSLSHNRLFEHSRFLVTFWSFCSWFLVTFSIAGVLSGMRQELPLSRK
jgi:hypothetical protein